MKNQDAFIAKLVGIDVEKDVPYAELWMGTHPNAPSQVIDLNQGPVSLADWIQENPKEHLSLNRLSSFPNGLPFLFKVLSANEALSIQAHPNKVQAEYLHHQDPEHYPDDNHKPEIAIAIDSLDALVGLISSDNYQQLLLDVPEFQTMGLGDVTTKRDVHKAVLTLLELWNNDPPRVESHINAIYQRLNNIYQPNVSEQLFLDLARIHGREDIGLLFIFLLNRVHLGPGEALFLPAGVPHAYLQGNIIECMANSDNVVRVGLTNKFCDTKALTKILSTEIKTDYRVATRVTGYLTEYPTEVKEFKVKSLQLAERSSQNFSKHEDLTLFLVLDGEVNFHWCTDQSSCCSVFHCGDSFIAPANLPKFTIQAKKRSIIYWVELP